MSNSEHEDRVIRQYELHEFKIPELESEIVERTILSTTCLLLGTIIFEAGQRIGRGTDNYGKVPEIIGTVMASGPFTLGSMATIGIGMDILERHKLRKESNLHT